MSDELLPYEEVPAPDHELVVGDATQLVDVRQPAEVAGGTLPGALNIPLDQLERRVDELDPDRPVVLLCRSGNRSGTAATFLVAAGFTEVVNLTGGMLAIEAARG